MDWCDLFPELLKNSKVIAAFSAAVIEDKDFHIIDPEIESKISIWNVWVHMALFKNCRNLLRQWVNTNSIFKEDPQIRQAFSDAGVWSLLEIDNSNSRVAAQAAVKNHHNAQGYLFFNSPSLRDTLYCEEDKLHREFYKNS